MPKPTLIEAARVILDLLDQSTYPAWAGENCRSCPIEHHDGGCTQPHHESCKYAKAEAAAREFVKRVTGE